MIPTHLPPNTVSYSPVPGEPYLVAQGSQNTNELGNPGGEETVGRDFYLKQGVQKKLDLGSAHLELNTQGQC